jgi:hypothetical protein
MVFSILPEFNFRVPRNKRILNFCAATRKSSTKLESLKETGRKAELLPHEIPAKILLEPVHWSIENNLLTVSFKLARASL